MSRMRTWCSTSALDNDADAGLAVPHITQPNCIWERIKSVRDGFVEAVRSHHNYLLNAFQQRTSYRAGAKGHAARCQLIRYLFAG
jgi:hypothetical protein